ncbi:hypothetical protein A8L34_11245 [Bacillus sp. FJAT-27264]|nr:hypothetical protein A8L34_11245 [Bacillus sp. FJAT-27264]
MKQKSLETTSHFHFTKREIFLCILKIEDILPLKLFVRGASTQAKTYILLKTKGCPKQLFHSFWDTPSSSVLAKTIASEGKTHVWGLTDPIVVICI